jgi:hypothetical protein
MWSRVGPASQAEGEMRSPWDPLAHAALIERYTRSLLHVAHDVRLANLASRTILKGLMAFRPQAAVV